MATQTQNKSVAFDGSRSELQRLRVELAATKRALAELEGQYRQFIETSSEGALVRDAQGVITYVNEQMAALLGYSTIELVGRTVGDFVTDEQRVEFAARMEERQAGKSASYELCVKHKDGSPRWVRVSGVPLFDANQHFQGAFGLFTDITDQKHAQVLLIAERDLGMALSEVHTLQEALHHCLTVAIAVSGMDSGGIYLMAEDGTLELASSLGLSEEFLMSATRFARDSPNTTFVREGQARYCTHKTAGFQTDAHRLAEGLRAMAIIPIRERGEVIACMNLASHRNDEIPTWSRSALEDIASRIGSAIVRTRAEEAQRRVERDYKTLFDQMLDGFVVHDVICDEHGKAVDLRFLAVNPAFERMTGHEAKRLVGKTAREVTPELETSWIEMLGNVGLTGIPAHLERYLAPLKRHVDVSAFQTTKGQSASIVTDVSARKLLEEQYHQSQKMEAVGRLAGGVAHDLNNLLTPILAYAEMLGEDFAPDDPRLNSVLEMQEAGARARDLVRQLLAFSRKQTLDFKALNLTNVVRKFEKLLRRTLREDIRIIIDLEANLGHVCGDVGQLEQVIMNLAVNAQDAMAKGGELRIKTANLVLDEKYAAAHMDVPPGRYAELSISDSGAGMSGELQKKVFEPFFTTKALGEGTGLGLATVYGVVKQHGGCVLVYSEVGVGSTFRLLFPVIDEEVVVDATSEDNLLAARRACVETIMVVEDNEMVRNLTTAVLGRQGYTVLQAQDAQTCIATLRAPNIVVDLVLTDVIMPDMNGKALFGIISQMCPTAKVVYMSGYPQDVISEHGVLEQNLEFIQKPFSVKALCAKVREVLDR